ncbi:MAG: response regulator transcription factor [Anaerolineae bacterium]|nr:response regulator transcription factor [Anaerolineae bacterium]
MEQGRVRVLIAEDDLLVCEMIRGLLQDGGYQVVGEAVNGHQVIDLIVQLEGTPQRPDVVLMDVEMPEMNGVEATQQILAEHPLPVVALTAYETPDWVRRMTDAGIGAYLVKPSNAREIERAITVAMARFKDMQKVQHLNAELAARNRKLEAALAHVKLLQGLLPICAHCKKIRDDSGYWHDIDVYLSEHTDTQFTHGLCPDCQIKLYPPEIYPYLYENDD